MTLDGGNAGLDFVNSGYGTEAGQLTERLHSYNDLLLLSARTGIIDNKMHMALRAEARSHPRRASAALAEAKIVRGALYEILKAAVGLPPVEKNSRALNTFNSYLSETLQHRKVTLHQQQFISEWNITGIDLKQPLRIFILAVYDLITGPYQMYIKQCGACEWFFVDQTKNHKKRWCTMKSCGNAEKTKRYYIKKKNELA